MSDAAEIDQPLASDVSMKGPLRRFGPPERWLEHLLAVIPIVQSRISGDVMLTLYSLDSFTEGFRIRGRLTNDNARTKVRRCGYPSLSMQARDDQGGEYDCAHGSGGGTYDEWEFAIISERALNPTAQRLVIMVSEIEWRDFSKPPLESVVARELTDITFEVAVSHAS